MLYTQYILYVEYKYMYTNSYICACIYIYVSKATVNTQDTLLDFCQIDKKLTPEVMLLRDITKWHAVLSEWMFSF